VKAQKSQLDCHFGIKIRWIEENVKEFSMSSVVGKKVVVGGWQLAVSELQNEN